MRFGLCFIMMLALVRIQDGRAADTNPPAVIENLFAAPLASSTPAKLLPTLDVRTYQIEGNTALLPEEFGMLSNYTGKVDSPRVREGLDKLQGRYGELGFSNVKVTLPEQKFTNGLVRIQIINGDTGTNTEAALAAAITNLFTVPEKKQIALFEILQSVVQRHFDALLALLAGVAFQLDAVEEKHQFGQPGAIHAANRIAPPRVGTSQE